MNHIKMNFKEINYKQAPISFENHQLFYLRDKRILSIIEKRDLLIAMSDDLKIYMQIFSLSPSVLKKEFHECSKALAASLVLEGKLKSVFCLAENNMLKAIYDEDSFLHAVKKDYKFYIQ